MNKSSRLSITGLSSVFLDFLRLSAALVVFIYHSNEIWFPANSNSSHILGKAAHAAVVVFFVLSGYVIAFSTSIHNRGPRQYIHARLTRLYSIVVPSLFITGLVEIFISYWNPPLMAEFSRGVSWPRYILSGLFMNEIWFFSAAPPLNTPLWSLSNEFWYYSIFGLFFFSTGLFSKYFLSFLGCLLAGPKILIMMPIWLIGFGAYYFSTVINPRLKSWLSVLLFLIFTFLAVAYLPAFPDQIGARPFIFASQFLTDYAVALTFALTLLVIPISSGNKSIFWTRNFRKIADLTFPIYVLHFPLLIFWRACINYKKHNSDQMYQGILVVFALSVVIGLFLEQQRRKWSDLFKVLINISVAKVKAVRRWKTNSFENKFSKKIIND